MGWMYYYDYYFLILVVPAMLIALWAQIKVKTTFASQSKRLSSRGLTGAQAAMQVLKYYGINDVRIERVAGDLTDHYDPKRKVIRLSKDVYEGSSVSSMAIASHECGHAIQDKEGYLFLRFRSLIFPVVNVATSISYYIILIGFILSHFEIVTLLPSIKYLIPISSNLSNNASI